MRELHETSKAVSNRIASNEWNTPQERQQGFTNALHALMWSGLGPRRESLITEGEDVMHD
jgi:hypothetical protein